VRPPAASLPRRLGLTALTAFSEIMRTGSATGAARVLGLSQPAISRLIARMESDIGFELFYRDKGRLVPTEEAHQLFVEAHEVQVRIDAMKAVIDNLRRGSEGDGARRAQLHGQSMILMACFGQTRAACSTLARSASDGSSCST